MPSFHRFREYPVDDGMAEIRFISSDWKLSASVDRRSLSVCCYLTGQDFEIALSYNKKEQL